MKIGFVSEQLDVRGTCVSMYDYADYNEKLLNNKSVIFTVKNSNHDQIAIDKFVKRFTVIFCDNFNDIDNNLDGCEILYIIKYGTNDGKISKKIKTVIHCVFDLSDPHGDVYAAVSSTLAKKYGKTLYVPHMIALEPSKTGENLREELGIPKDGIVFGRHGGMDTFDLQWARVAIVNAINLKPNLYCVFVNTPVFYRHPRMFFLNKIVTSEQKNKFISTCDAHLECGSLGHSFGLSMGEFSVNNKPIIAFKTNGWMWNTAHLDILGDKGIYYKDENELYKILLEFNPGEYKTKDNNCYKDYTPEKVMEIFDKVFVKNNNLKNNC